MVKAIVDHFGSKARLYLYSVKDLTAEELVDFLEAHEKFMPAAKNTP